jgi:hypothetical protein
MNKSITLKLSEVYNHVELDIDITSFSCYCPTLGYDYADMRDDVTISFRLSYPEESIHTLGVLSDSLKLNVDKAKYVILRTKFEDWESDKRPRFSVRLPSGYRGIVNPSEFRFIENIKG